MNVLLATEDSYPFHADDAAAWADTLTRELTDVDFTVLSVTTHPYVRQRFEVPKNVRAVINVPISGMQDPAEYGHHASLPGFIKSRWAMSAEDVEQDFVPHYEQFLRGIAQPDSPPWSLAVNLLQMHLHLRFYDYDATHTHPSVWKKFASVMQEEWHRAYPMEQTPPPDVFRNGWQCLYRLLLPLALDVPHFDLVHSSSASYCGLPCVISKLRHHTPYLLTEQGVYLREHHAALGGAPLSPFLRWFLSRLAAAVVRVNYAFADQVSPVCRHHTRWEQWLGVEPERVQVIYNGVDDAVPSPLAGSKPVEPTVATAGPITATSGHADLIEAIALIRRSLPGIRLRIVGSGDESAVQQCRDLVHGLGLEEAVAFEEPGRQTLRQGAHVFALPTVSDTFPRALIEAMLSETPVVATNVGGIPEAVGETAMLVPPADPAAMAESIVTLLQSPDSSAGLARHARERALELFSKERFAQAYRAAYDKLTDRDFAGDQRPIIVDTTNVAEAAPIIPSAA
jgi:glycosyltransferase involved in cell wall biosynthesis